MVNPDLSWSGRADLCHTSMVNRDLYWSGRADLNRRPLGPEPSALAGLSHAPNACIIP